MRWIFSFLLLLSLVLLETANALSSSGNRLLVISEDESYQDSLKTFWGDLEEREFKISFESPKSDKLDLFDLGERAYDHLIILPSKSKGLGPALTPQKLLDFINSDGNILITLSGDHHTPTGVLSLLLELDIHLSPDRNSVVVDHFNYDTLSAAEKHDVLVMPLQSKLRPDVKDFFSSEGILAIPKPIGQTLGNASPLLVPILRAPDTAYSYNYKEETEVVEDPFATGSQLALVTAVQARNSARLTVIGSVEMLEDKWFDATVKGLDGKETKTANREFAKHITEWTFKEVGVLKVGRLEHYLSESPAGNDSLVATDYMNPKIYRIKNDVTFNIELSEYSHDYLVPYILPDGDSIQLEFSMLSPFHRLALTPISNTPNSTIYSVSFTLPDQHGIFRFEVNYKRLLLTNVDEKREVTVRHFAHDEWPRSFRISGAWVWISGIWVVVAGWIGFLALWLYSAPVDQAKKEKKTQ
ncbi:MAG: oligosaccharyl transferase glycoprotein complex, beta subunit [Cirrosporium novae-zelandiae]|nr:MAG: oligosaccharyl transferase glycoprotein complex, beta subunit [Cirrosporium novae-zelandiae]